MRLLGVFEEMGKEFVLTQDGNRFYKTEKNGDTEETFESYNFVKNRDVRIGSEPVEGEGVFNFRYGPVTTGVKEAGLFNIYTYGERILAMNIDPSYKRRNIEKLMIGKDLNEALKLAQSVCGNFSFSHSLSFCRGVESILGLKIDNRSLYLRVIGLELERLYNHVNVMLRLSKGASQNVLTSHLSWIFEELLRINNELSGSRFLKGMCKIGGVCVNRSLQFNPLRERLKNIKEKFGELYEHSLKSYNFIDRIHNTAPLSSERALSIGVTGPTLRACGIYEDLRLGEVGYENLNRIAESGGDSLARMEVRAEEFLNSIDIIDSTFDKVANLRDIGVHKDLEKLSGEGMGYTESPSGVLVYYLKINKGRIENVYISTPSIFGFKAFCEAFEGFIFTDFGFAFDSFGIHFSDCVR